MIFSETSLLCRSIISLAVTLALGSFGGAQSVVWSPSLDDALALAKKEGRVIMVSANMEGDRESDRLVEDHFQDPIIASLLQNTVNVFCADGSHKKSGVCPRCKQNDCASHRNNGFNVRRMLFGQEGHERIRSPQHVFLSPQGKVYSSAIGRVTVGELEWMIREALRATGQHKEIADAGTERSHAPTSYRRGSVDSAAKAKDPMPTKKQLAEAMEQSKRNTGGGGRRGRRGRRGGSTPDWVEVLVRVDDRKAKSSVGNYLKSTSSGRARTLSLIGRESPLGWDKALSDWLSSDDDATRRSAVVALGRMADPKSLSPLRKYHRKEKVEDLEGRFLRSLSAVAPTNAAVVSAVVKAATKHNVMLVRAHAMVAAGFLELRQPSLTCLRSGLQDPSVVVRAVTAYVIAERQFQELSGALSKSLEAEDDDEIRGWMEKAVAALSSRDPKEFDGFLGLTIDKPTSGRGGPGRNRREAGEGTEGGDAGKGASRRRRKGGDSGGKGKLE